MTNQQDRWIGRSLSADLTVVSIDGDKVGLHINGNRLTVSFRELRRLHRAGWLVETDRAPEHLRDR